MSNFSVYKKIFYLLKSGVSGNDLNRYLEQYSYVRYFQNAINFNGTDIFVHDYRNLSNKVVEREEYIITQAKGKSVLHFGFLDSPFTSERIKNKKLLHLRLKNKSKDLFGLDVDKQSLDIYRNATSDFNNDIADLSKPMTIKSNITNKFELILFGEILEHLNNPGIALQNIRKISKNNKNSTVIITVPNAFSYGGIVAASRGYEMVHPEHYYYFSPSTITKLLQDNGFKDISIVMYANKDFETIDSEGLRLPGITQSGLVVSCRV